MSTTVLTQAAPPNLRARQRELRRRKFVTCAERLFLRHGFAGTSVNAIVRIAGGSLATLYAEFGTKEKLFEAVILRRVRSAFAAADRVPAGTDDVRKRLVELAGRIHARTLSPDALAIYRLAVSEGPRFKGLRDAVLDLGLNSFLARLAELFATLDRSGVLAVNDAGLAAQRFLALVQGQHQFIAGCGETRPLPAAARARHVEQAVDAFLTLYPPPTRHSP